MSRSRLFILVSAAALTASGSVASAALYSEDFNADHTANWTINDPGLSDTLADFFYDYSSIGVPSANGGDTRGLKLTANNSGGVFSGFSVSPNSQNFTGSYTVSFDLWQNYVGPLGIGGSGTTQLSMFGVGTAGNTAVWAGSPKESVAFGVTLDGGSSSDFRAYSSAAPTRYVDGDPVYFTASTNGSDPYYTAAFPGGDSAPAAQVGLYPGQTGTTDAGEISFGWRKVVITVDGGFATWAVDGTPLAKVDLSTVTLGGGNIFFGHGDTNGSSSSDANDTLLNITLVDNVVVDVVPEPTGLALFGFAGLGVLARRRRA